MSYFRTVLKRPVSVILIMFSIVLFGIISIKNMQMEYFPDLNMPMEMVLVTYPGADSDSVERLVTEPIEDIGGSLTGVNSVESRSYENYCMVQFSYDYDIDLNDAYMELKSELDNIADDLPDDCHTPQIMEIGINNESTISIAASSVDGSDILDYVNDELKPALEKINGVAKVDIKGGRENYAKIVLDEGRLKSYGLSIAEVASAIGAADFDMPVGTIEFGSNDVAANAYSEIDWHTSLPKVALKTSTGALISLSDVAGTINLFGEDPDTISRFNGRDSVLIEIEKKSSAGTIGVCSAVEKALKENTNTSIEYEVVSSSADDIMDTLTEVLKTLIEGIVITMAVLLIFLGDIKASLIVGSSMPLSIFIAVMILNLMGMPFDLMTGTGMIIAIGMLVDNSIVVLESCFRMKEETDDYHSAALKGASTMIFSVIGSTLTTIVVYAPIAMSGGMSGQMNKPLCYSIIFTMTASLMNSVTVVPLLFTLWKPKAKEDLPVNKVLDKLRGLYRKVIPGFMKRPVIPVVAAVVLLIFSAFLFSTLNLDIFPPNHDGSINVEADFRSGTKKEVMDERIRSIEEKLLSDDNFESVRLTIDSEGANITAYSAPSSGRSSEDAVSEYTKLFSNVTDMDLSITPTGVTTGLASLMSDGNAKTITIEGTDMDALSEAASLLEDRIRSVPGVMGVRNTTSMRQTNARFNIDQQAAVNAGFQPSSVANQIYQMLNGITADTLEMEDGKEYDVKVQFPDNAYNDPVVLLSQYITSPDGRNTALKDICSIEYTEIMQDIHRVDGYFTAEVKAIVDSKNKYRISDDISAAVKEVALPEGVSLAESTVDKRLSEEMTGMGNALITAILLVFLVMAVQFESVRYSLMVMMCIPFSLIGSFAFMFILNEPISMMAMMGILMLVGMVVNNGILLVDGTNELLKQGMEMKEALTEAGITRLRPILMTTLTTVLSMLPLILSGDSGMNMMHGMGVVIIGGLTASTLLAMFLMPPFYLLISKKEKK
ncbi:MAG: efflux RND transporter permease subunit [Lachnospiraceae bacterium]|nr:efflux RND transporter permease subunit [Lachnospiraceae bacterium]